MSVWDAIDAVRADLAAPDFAAYAGEPSSVTQTLRAEQNAGENQYDWHIAHNVGYVPHDMASYEDKVGADASQGQGGNGGGGTSGGGNGSQNCASCHTPLQRARCYITGTCGGKSGGGGKGGGKGGKHGKGGHGGHSRGGGRDRRGRRGGGLGGGGGLAGPGSLGNIKPLGNVPIGTSATGASSAPNPVLIVIVIGGLGVGGYLLYHKLHMAKAQEGELSKGKVPGGAT